MRGDLEFTSLYLEVVGTGRRRRDDMGLKQHLEPWQVQASESVSKAKCKVPGL